MLVATGGSCGVDTLYQPTYVNINPGLPCIYIMSPGNNNDDLIACYGTLFDTGGPASDYQNNTYSEITIAPFGAIGVSLDFQSFKMEAHDTLYVYDGPTTNSPLIGKYTGTSLPNGGNIVASGGAITLVQESDIFGTFFGFEIDWNCIYGNTLPVANFSASPTITCTGEVAFQDLSTGNPSAWQWDFGDGNSSLIPNPTHTYTGNGVYTVKLVASNVNGADSLIRSGYVIVNRPASPVATGDQSCNPAQLTLTASGTGTLEWYDSPTSTNVLGTGTSFTTPLLGSTQTYYVQSNNPAPSSYIGPANSSIGPSTYVYGSTIDYLTFDAFQDITIQSVWVDALTAGNKAVMLLDGQGNLVAFTSFFVSTPGPQRATLNLDVPAGTGWRLGGRFMNCAVNTSGASFPYVQPGLVSITGSSNPGHYYYYYDWEVAGGSCSSLRTPVLAEIGVGGTTPTVSPAGPISFCDGQDVTLTAGSGTTWLWSNGDTTQSTTVSTTGNYTVTVSNGGGGCGGTSDPVSVTVNPPLNVTASPASALVCAGDSVTLTASGGVSYVWSHGPTSTQVQVPAGSYSVSATDAQGCTGVSNTVNVTTANPTASISGSTEICAGGAEILTANAGSAYLWSTGETTRSITITAPGTYSVTVTDLNGCDAISAPYVVNPGAGPTAGISPAGPIGICSGGSTLLTASGGVSYLWSTGATTPTLTVSTPGNYYVIAFNAGGCRDTSSLVTVVENVPTATISVTGRTTLCPGETVTLTANSGTGYSWSTSATTSSIVVSTPGTYTVSLTDSNGCAATSAPLTVTALAPPTATLTPAGPWAVCPGESINITAAGGVSYLWSDAQTSPTNSLSAPGNYYVIATDANGCTDTSATYGLSQFTPVANISGSNQVCPGDSVVLTANPGTNFNWSNGGTRQSVSVSAGSYTVSLQDSNGCAASSAPFIVSNLLPPTAGITGNTVFCPGSSTVLTASGGTAYTWSTGSTGATLNVNTPGDYFVIAQDAQGCTDTSATLNVTTFTPVAGITVMGSSQICAGDSVELVASAGTNFLWSTGETTASIWAHTAGTYTVSLTDPNGCTATSAPVNITNSPTVTADIVPAGNSLICPGDSLLFTATGGSSYAWSNGATTANTYISAPGTYYVVATNTAGCTDTSDVVTLGQYTPVANISGLNQSCVGIPTPLTASTGSSFLWSNGETTQEIQAEPGSYTVTLTDSNGCVSTSAPFVVTNFPTPTATITPNTATQICPGASATFTAGGGVSYLWSTGSTNSSVSVSTPGNVFVIATGPNGCKDTSAVVTVSNFTPVAAISAGGSTALCPGDSVELTASTGTNLLWSTGETTPSVWVSNPTSFTVSLVDSNGCSATSAPVNITQLTPPVATISPAGP